ncbi:MAG: hypothetical protein QXZ70_07490, partial [Candidatus Bathyarchaeia archaeon]
TTENHRKLYIYLWCSDSVPGSSPDIRVELWWSIHSTYGTVLPVKLYSLDFNSPPGGSPNVPTALEFDVKGNNVEIRVRNLSSTNSVDVMVAYYSTP